MKQTKNFLSFDIGASGGKAFLGRFDGEKLFHEEVYRFQNIPVSVRNELHWDVLSLFAGIKQGLSAYSRKYGKVLSGVGVDTWGVDFGLLDSLGNLLGNPYHYRDRKNAGMAVKIEQLIGGYDIYSATGMKLSDISTLSQLFSLKERACPQLDIAKNILLMPSLLAYFLSGEMALGYSIMTPSCLYDINKNRPAEEFLNKLNIPSGMIGRVIDPGTCIGDIRRDITEQSGLSDTKLISPAMHDTASAVIAVPAEKETEWAFISSGTWCVVGAEIGEPLICREGYNSGIVNSGISGNRYMLTGNVTGMWLIQECMRVWESRGEYLTYPDIIKLAQQASSFSAFIDVDDERFAGFTDMPSAIMSYCKGTGQKIPGDKGTLTRVVLESIVMKQKQVVETLQRLTGKKYNRLHIEGGGRKNYLLCQFTANATGIPVIAGPTEGTGLGNIIMQMVADGQISSVEEGRDIIRKSVLLEHYMPQDADLWQQAYYEYQNIIGGSGDG